MSSVKAQSKIRVEQSTSDLPADILTIAVEDYFQGRALESIVERRQWTRFESRVERNTLASLELLEKYETKATFFFTTWIASKLPDLVREVVRRGHEVGNSGDSRRSFRMISPEDFAWEVCVSREVLESIAGVRVRGFRVADHRLTPGDLWALRILAEKGYDYDSSIHPSAFAFCQQRCRRVLHQEQFEEQRLWEVPLSSVSCFGVDVPIAGGNWFRQLPEAFIQRSVDRWNRNVRGPFVMYFRVWDLDPRQPVITAASNLSRLRHYRNPERVPRLIETFLAKYRFDSIAGYLQLARQEACSKSSAEMAGAIPVRRDATPAALPQLRTPVAVVVPCYNEENTLPYLANTLDGLNKALDRYDLRFVFVDDGSRDHTPDLLHSLFAHRAGCQIVHLPRNSGVASAILNGIRRADTEIVCSMDCDCTYDPSELANMIPMITPGIDLVTASPYHPKGCVKHVPSWRLLLSKSASLLYGSVLRQRLHTYTSCFRVYRRSVVETIDLDEEGFLGVAELIGKLDLNGSRIAEYPTTLEVRLLGQSKMRILRTIFGHLRLIGKFAFKRLSGHIAPLKPESFPDGARSSFPRGISE